MLLEELKRRVEKTNPRFWGKHGPLAARVIELAQEELDKIVAQPDFITLDSVAFRVKTMPSGKKSKPKGPIAAAPQWERRGGKVVRKDGNPLAPPSFDMK